MHKIDINDCIDCGFCASICPKKAISARSDFAYEIDSSCINCTLCAKNCPVNAISGSVREKKEKVKVPEKAA